MDREVYEGVVERLEAEAAHNPAAFRCKILLVSCAAYLTLFATLIGVAVLIYADIHWTSYLGVNSPLPNYSGCSGSAVYHGR